MQKQFFGTLIKEELQAKLESLKNNQKLLITFAFFLLSFNIFFGLSFTDLFMAILFSILFSIFGFFSPRLSLAILLFFCFLAFSNISPLLGWAYFILIGAIFYFEFSSNWLLFLIGHLAVLMPITFSHLGGFLTIALLAFSSYYFGSKKGLFLSLSWFIFYMLAALSINFVDIFSIVEKEQSFNFSLKPRLSAVFSNIVGILSSFLSFSSLVGFFPFLFNLLWKAVYELFFRSKFLYLIFWSATFFLLPKIYVYLKQQKNPQRFATGFSSLALIVLFFSNMVYAFAFNSELNFLLLFYSLGAAAIFFALDFFSIPICNELKLIALNNQKMFGKFGLQNITLQEGGPSSLADVGGYKNLKEELLEAIALPLKQPELSKAYKLDPVKGILLFGPPGSGKTLIISALAKELQIPFYYVKCSDILSSWYGESEKNISELFSIARKNAPCIVFIDEIDAIARSRDLFFQDDIGPRILSVLLTEMDGIKSSTSKPVIIIGATNAPDKLDSAILRPGRLDKIIYMPLPDMEARKEILKIHTKNLQLDADVNLEQIAQLTENFSGADLANLVQEAKRLAIRESRAKNRILPLSQKHFLSLLNIIKPSVSQRQLLLYKKFEEEYKRSIS
ncbi:MAG: ATP-binding protein [Candidatus Anstonellaceae archaeon]